MVILDKIFYGVTVKDDVISILYSKKGAIINTMSLYTLTSSFQGVKNVGFIKPEGSRKPLPDLHLSRC